MTTTAYLNGRCHICQEHNLLDGRLHCPRCGRYQLTSDAEIIGLRPSARYLLSAKCREQTDFDFLPALEITAELLSRVRDAKLPSLTDRVTALLRYAADNFPMGKQVSFSALPLHAATCSANVLEIRVLANFAESQGWIQIPQATPGFIGRGEFAVR